MKTTLQAILADPRLQPPEVTLLCHLLVEGAQERTVQIGQKEIARRMRRSHVHINKVFRRLKKLGWINSDRKRDENAYYRIGIPQKEGPDND